MKKFVLVAAIAGSLVSGQAIAACTTGTRLDAAAISKLLGGNTVCVPAGIPAPDPMTWQEEHAGTSTSTTGALIDFKRGASTVDPTKTVGTWTVTGTGVGNSFVTHAYSGGGGSYTYSVHSIGGSIYGFCGAGPEIVARVKPGNGAC